MNDDSADGSNARGFFQRYGFALGIAGIGALTAVVFAGQSLFQHGPAPKKAQEISMVRIMPSPLPPPPPPPPPPEQRIIRDEMIQQQQLEQPDPEPKDAPPPANDVGTNLKGEGPADGFGLSGNGNAGFVLGGRGNGNNNNANRWGAYAARVQASISEALLGHAKTRDGAFRVVVRIWPDAAGRILRAQLTGSTGDVSVDRAIRDDVLTGLQLAEPPPEGMPSPIVMRLTARRPN